MCASRLSTLCRRRLLVVVALVLAGTLGGIEQWARRRHLDLWQGLNTGMPGTDTVPRSGHGVDLSDVDYVPRGFALTPTGFTSRWGACDLTRPHWLALGDSTTTQTTDDGRPSDFANAWPRGVRTGGPPVCVLAEVGYHPSDLVALVEALGDRLAPERTLLLLCGNDLGEVTPRRATNVQGRWALASPPTRFTVWKDAHWPWLFSHSEAWRFTTWQIALRTGRSSTLPAAPTEVRQALPALRRLAELRPITLMLPRLEAAWMRPVELDGIARDAGLDVSLVPRPPDPVALRRDNNDTVHLNEQGHAWVAAAFQAEVDAAEAAGSPLPPRRRGDADEHPWPSIERSEFCRLPQWLPMTQTYEPNVPHDSRIIQIG